MVSGLPRSALFFKGPAPSLRLLEYFMAAPAPAPALRGICKVIAAVAALAPLLVLILALSLRPSLCTLVLSWGFPQVLAPCLQCLHSVFSGGLRSVSVTPGGTYAWSVASVCTQSSAPMEACLGSRSFSIPCLTELQVMFSQSMCTKPSSFTEPAPSPSLPKVPTLSLLSRWRVQLSACTPAFTVSTFVLKSLHSVFAHGAHAGHAFAK
jgi:hypothetical protein